MNDKAKNLGSSEGSTGSILVYEYDDKGGLSVDAVMLFVTKTEPAFCCILSLYASILGSEDLARARPTVFFVTDEHVNNSCKRQTKMMKIVERFIVDTSSQDLQPFTRRLWSNFELV